MLFYNNIAISAYWYANPRQLIHNDKNNIKTININFGFKEGDKLFIVVIKYDAKWVQDRTKCAHLLNEQLIFHWINVILMLVT